MKVQIHVLRRGASFRDRMRKDGWKLEFQDDDSLIAVHPQVTDSGEARQRLDRLGILTSRSIRIDFPLTAIRPPARACSGASV
jgi:hypothetical protein